MFLYMLCRGGLLFYKKKPGRPRDEVLEFTLERKTQHKAVDEEPPSARFGRPRNKADRFAGGSTSKPCQTRPGGFVTETRVGEP